MTLESSKKLLGQVLSQIVRQPELHERWLATLSYLECCGARKIAGFLPDGDVNLVLLRHAAEEARHAYFFKNQILKIREELQEPYTLLGGFSAKHYLRALDSGISRLLKSEQNLTGRELKHGAYLLTTLTIEERAAIVYPLYQEILEEHQLKVSLKSVILEEDRHLAEIHEELDLFPQAQEIMDQARALENKLYEAFIQKVNQEICSLVSC